MKQLRNRLRRHPSAMALSAYVEARVAGSGVVSAEIGGHVTACAKCRREAAAIENTFAVCQQSAPLTSRTTARARILLQARELEHTRPSMMRRRIQQFSRGFVYVAATLLVAVQVYWVALAAMEQRIGATSGVPALVAEQTASVSEDTLNQANHTIQKLAVAVQGAVKQSSSLQEQQQWRAINAIDKDISAALKALEVNPGCVRATHIINANLQRQAQALRNFYLERTL